MYYLLAIDYDTLKNYVEARKMYNKFVDTFTGKEDAYVKYAKQRINEKYNVFDPLGTDKGEFVKEWRLRLNITRDEILGICNKQY